MPTMGAFGKCQDVWASLRTKITVIEFSNSGLAIQRIICEINESAFNIQIAGEYFALALFLGKPIICIRKEQVEFFYFILIDNAGLVPQISSSAIFKIGG